MKVQKDTFLIRVQSDRINTGIAGIGGKEIIIDSDYNKYKHTTQIGIIHACPIKITKQYLYDTELNVGDTVAFHHFVCQADHKIEDGVYRAEYFHLYALLKDSSVEPLEDVIFVEPILESEDSLYAGNIRIKSHQENIKQCGIVFAASKKAKAMGVRDGDKVFFSKDADYKMKLIDKVYYRMRIRNITAIERDGKLICLNDKFLVKQFGPENKSGIFVDVKQSHQMRGDVVFVGDAVWGAVQEGDAVSYYNGSLGTIEWKGDTYATIELRNLNYKIE